MYVDPNFQTKKALKEAVARGDKVRVYSPEPFPAKINDVEEVEGPHHPEPHRWYARVELKKGLVIKVVA